MKNLYKLSKVLRRSALRVNLPALILTPLVGVVVERIVKSALDKMAKED